MSRNDNKNPNDAPPPSNNRNNNNVSPKTARNRARRERRTRAKQRARANKNQNQPQQQQQSPIKHPPNRSRVIVSDNREPGGRGRGRGVSSWSDRGRGGGYRGNRANYASSARRYDSNRNRNKKEIKPKEPIINEEIDKKPIINEEIDEIPLKYTDEGIDDKKMKDIHDAEHEEKIAHLNIEELQTLFLGENFINDHIRALNINRDIYIEQLRLFIKYGVIVKVSTSTKSKILCALLIRNERETVQWLMSHERYYSVGEIAKCIQLLDAPRKARQFRRKLDKLLAMKKKDNKSVKDKTISSLRTKIHNLELDPHKGSLNGAKCRMFKKWIENIPKNRLEFFLLNFGTANWKLICDLIHPHPKKHFKCKYFQNAVFENKNDEKVIDENNKKLPKNSLVYNAKRANKANIVDLLQKYPYLSECYSYLRKILLKLEDNAPNNNRERRNRNNNNESMEMIESKIAMIESLGFNRHEALCALNRNHLNIENAAEWLFDTNNRNQCKNIEETSYYRYDFKKKMDEAIPNEAKHILAENAPLEDVLWWYHELHSKEVEMEVMERLKDSLEKKENIFNDDSPRSNYGKLMERILLFREQKYKFVPYLTNHAQLRLENIKFDELNEEGSFIRCVVFGDASGSMEVAIKSSCIIASLLSVALNADLKFFNSDVFDPPVIPRSVSETIEVVNKISARGGTCMASAIYPYLANKTKIDLFILVSDEGENEKYNGQYFSSLFKTYKNNINPKAQLFLVSFVNVGDEGTILKRLKDKKVDDKCIKQFRLHPDNPDTSKFNALLGMVAMALSKMKQHFYVLNYILMHQYNVHKQDANTVSNIICSYL